MTMPKQNSEFQLRSAPAASGAPWLSDHVSGWAEALHAKAGRRGCVAGLKHVIIHVGSSQGPTSAAAAGAAAGTSKSGGLDHTLFLVSRL